MLALLIGYWRSPALRTALADLATLKAGWGYTFSALAALLAGALLPELLRLIAILGPRQWRQCLANLRFTMPFWATMGIIVDLLYRTQARILGDSTQLHIVITKVAIDQFLYSPLISAPLTVWFYTWKNSGSPPPFQQILHPAHYRRHVLPVLIANWAVWIPVVSIVYCLPQPLQIPMFALALTLWVTLYTWMSEQRPAPH